MLFDEVQGAGVDPYFVAKLDDELSFAPHQFTTRSCDTSISQCHIAAPPIGDSSDRMKVTHKGDDLPHAATITRWIVDNLNGRPGCSPPNHEENTENYKNKADEA